MNLGLPEKYAGEAGTIRAGRAANWEKSIGGAAGAAGGAGAVEPSWASVGVSIASGENSSGACEASREESGCISVANPRTFF